jgi:type IV fimbrial biogenesis protein FimT
MLVQHHSKQIGFSLIEVMIVVALFAVLATFAIPSYQQMIQNSMIKTATDSIVTGFQIARGEAVKRNTFVQLELGGGNGTAWNVCVKPTPAPTTVEACTDAGMIQTRLASEGSSDKITTVRSHNGPYVFNGFGVMTNPTGGLTIAVDTTETSVSGRALQIVIGAGGAVRSCDPALDASGTDPRRC